MNQNQKRLREPRSREEINAVKRIPPSARIKEEIEAPLAGNATSDGSARRGRFCASYDPLNAPRRDGSGGHRMSRSRALVGRVAVAGGMEKRLRG
jgi:hypothetical protein